MPRKRLPYQEGDWFAVPLRDGGYALGLVARMDGEGRVFGYFFGPRRDRLPTDEDTAGLTSKQALLICKFGDLGLIRGEWPIIVSTSNWDPNRWPFAQLSRIAVDDSWATLVEYDEASFQRLREMPVSVEEARQHPEDGLSGYGAIEIRLTKLLAE